MLSAMRAGPTVIPPHPWKFAGPDLHSLLLRENVPLKEFVPISVVTIQTRVDELHPRG
jgi:hypothetical protein